MAAPYPAHLRGASRRGHPWHGTWASWRQMLRRCRSDSRAGYEHVRLEDPRWESFPCFAEDMGMRPPGCSIDRTDSARGYSASTCRWAGPALQASNRRSARMLSLPGIRGEASLTTWAEVYCRDPAAVRDRLRRGWTLEEALDTPTRRDHDAGLEARRRSNREGMRRLRARRNPVAA